MGLRGIRRSACALFELNRTTHTTPHRKTTRKQIKSDNDPKTALERAHRHSLVWRRWRRRRHGRRWRWLRARPTNAPGGSGRARQRAGRVVRVGAVQAAERGAECGRHLGERGAALKRRERGGQVGRRARRLAKDDSRALAHSQWQDPPRFIDASATSPASTKRAISLARSDHPTATGDSAPSVPLPPTSAPLSRRRCHGAAATARWPLPLSAPVHRRGRCLRGASRPPRSRPPRPRPRRRSPTARSGSGRRPTGNHDASWNAWLDLPPVCFA